MKIATLMFVSKQVKCSSCARFLAASLAALLAALLAASLAAKKDRCARSQ